MKLGSTIFILGAGGFARELKTYIQYHVSRQNQIPDVLGYTIYLVADNGDISVKEYHNKLSKTHGTYYSIMGSGQCDIKSSMLEEIRGPIMSFIHPSSNVIAESTIGKGSVIAPSAVIAPRANIGQHVLVNYGANIGHDSNIGNLSTISPGAFVGGSCKLDDRVYVGANASIKENTHIGARAIIGMGTVVLKDVKPGHIVIGNPGVSYSLEEWSNKCHSQKKN